MLMKVPASYAVHFGNGHPFTACISFLIVTYILLCHQHCLSYEYNLTMYPHLYMKRVDAILTFYFQVYSGARPLLEKTMKILVEGLVDIFLSVFHENKTKDIRLLDANGFCQLMLEVNVCYFYLPLDSSQVTAMLRANGSSALLGLLPFVLYSCSLSILRVYYKHTSHPRRNRL